MQKILDIIPRLSYEIIAYTIPGGLSLFVSQIVSHKKWNIGFYSDLQKYLENDKLLLGVVTVIISYVAGRILYAVADWTIKPFVKRTCGDPDKYLPFANFGKLRNHVEDYKETFKTDLKSRLATTFEIPLEHLSDTPYFKLCVQWLEHVAPNHVPLISHRHTIEIFARNLAAGALVITLLCVISKNLVGLAFSFLLLVVLTYYYYVRQIKRAKSVYETFFVLTSPSVSQPVKIDKENIDNLQKSQVALDSSKHS